jgi:predicted MPP superfamily phosphohydrolase
MSLIDRTLIKSELLPLIDNKVDKVTGKGLSTNDYDNNEKATLAGKADKSYVDTQIASVADGSPKGVYASLAALQSAYPSGTTGIYVTSDNGHWYFWSGSTWTDGGIYQSAGIADGSVTTAKRTHLGELGIVSTVKPVNFDFDAKTMTFPSDYSGSNIIWRNKYYIVPANTQVDLTLSGTTDRGVVVFNVDTKAFRALYSAQLSGIQENEIVIAVYWLSTKMVHMIGTYVINGETDVTEAAKRAITYAYIGYGYQPEILEKYSGSNIYFRLPSDSATIAIRPEQGYLFYKTWPELKTMFVDRIDTIDGNDYIVIPPEYNLVANIKTETFEIVYRTGINPLKHLVILGNGSGFVVNGPALHWVQDFKRISLTNRVAELEQGGDIFPAYIANDLENVNDQIRDLLINPQVLSFAAMTDTHSEDTYLAQTKEHARVLGSLGTEGTVDFICHLGDVISGYLDDKEDAKTNIANISKQLLTAKKPCFVLRGNHDDNSYYTTGGAVESSNVITPEEWYSRTIRPFDSVIHDSQDPSSSYYYYDFNKQKIRVVCLDSVNYPWMANPDGTLKWHGQNGWGFGIRQIHWLAEEALDLSDKDDWAVLILSHMPTRVELNCWNTDPINGELIEGVLKAFKNGTTYTGTSTETDWSTSINVDFTAQGSTELIGYIHGHLHADNVQTPVDLGWPYIAIANSFSGVVSASTLPAGAVAPSPRTAGTDTEDCWDMVAINRSARQINLIRYGAGSNRTVSY